MSRWNHSVCDQCWTEFFPKRGNPVRLKNAKMEYCCFCSQPHDSGIFVREDPSKMTCNGNHKETNEALT